MPTTIQKKKDTHTSTNQSGNPSASKFAKSGDKIDDKLPGKVIHLLPAANKSSRVTLTEDDVAKEFVIKYREDARFDHDARKWFFWDGKRWAINTTERGFDLSRELCRECRQGESRMASTKATQGVEYMARCDQHLAVTGDHWDRDPLLLGTPAGTVDLRTGELNEAKREAYISKLTAVGPTSPETPCPLFMKFISDATGGDVDVLRLLQQFAGYSLTGLTDAQVLLFIYGPGGNGKSVLQHVFAEIMGDYAKAAAMQTFAASSQQRHLTEIAMLRGARLVVSSETENGQQWNEARINLLTGGDMVTANFMRQNHFTFRPQFKLFMIGNHMPQLRTVNDAARRRFIVVPFLHKPKKPDSKLIQKLKAEYPAILRWMIEGCRDWQANGLTIPEAVTKATDEYFQEQDLFGAWIEERCDCGPGKQETASKLYASWKDFAEKSGGAPGSMTAFGSALRLRGFDKKKSGVCIYIGLKLK